MNTTNTELDSISKSCIDQARPQISNMIRQQVCGIGDEGAERDDAKQIGEQGQDRMPTGKGAGDAERQNDQERPCSALYQGLDCCVVSVVPELSPDLGYGPTRSERRVGEIVIDQRPRFIWKGLV